MHAKSWIMMRVLLNRYHRSIPESLLKYLPQSVPTNINWQNIIADDPAPALASPYEQLLTIHYSWLLPILKGLPHYVVKPFVEMLPDPQASHLQRLLSLPSPQPKPAFSKPVQMYISGIICSKVKPPEILPLSYLPSNPLFFLASLRKSQLILLIDFLGIHDLADSMRHIIDKEFLQKIYKCLNNQQRQFLRTCLHTQEKVITTPLDLKTWDGNQEKLNNMLQQRGLVRLGKALSGQHADFIWHVAHILDIGRGTILLRQYAPTTSPTIISRLIQQVNYLTNFLNLKSSP